MNGNGNVRAICEEALAITPSDTASLDAPAWIYVGGAGNVKVDTIGGDTVTFNGALAGVSLPVIAVKVYSTGTTATNMVACW